MSSVIMTRLRRRWCSSLLVLGVELDGLVEDVLLEHLDTLGGQLLVLQHGEEN